MRQTRERYDTHTHMYVFMKDIPVNSTELSSTFLISDPKFLPDLKKSLN